MKGLILLPALGMGTTQQVADFFEVGDGVINDIVSRHLEELKLDGYTVLRNKEVLNYLNKDILHLENLLSSQLATLEKSRGCYSQTIT